MRTLALSLALALALPCAGRAEAKAEAPKVRIGGLEVAQVDLLLTKKKGYYHLLWDAFPYKTALKGGDPAEKVPALLEWAFASKSDAKQLKLDIVEVPERDDYGAPRWETLKVIGQWECARPAKGKSPQPKARK
jgi:hypothetical protein